MLLVQLTGSLGAVRVQQVIIQFSLQPDKFSVFKQREYDHCWEF
jgi:hypothetical protein